MRSCLEQAWKNISAFCLSGGKREGYLYCTESRRGIMKILASLLAIISFVLLIFVLSGLRVPEQQPVPVSGLTSAGIPVSAPEVVPPALSFETLRIRRGATLESLLRKRGLAREETRNIIQTLTTVFNPRRLRAGDRLHLGFLPDGRLQELRYSPAAEISIRVDRTSGDRFTAVLDTLPTYSEETLVTGEIQTSLFEAILAAGESPELTMAFTDIFQWDIDFFTEPRRGDRFAILFKKYFILDPHSGMPTFLRYGDILAAAYIKKDHALIAYGYPRSKDGRMQYYDAEGKSFQKTFLRSPLNYRRISSYFSSGRRHPILKRVRAHTGVDFAAAKGTPVVASADGRVIHAGWLGGYGRTVKISHKNGTYVTLYGHLSRLARHVRKGASVRQNQVIGYVGATGIATGPHLHYTMYYNGRPVDPLKIRPAAGDPIDPSQRMAFEALQRQREKQLGISAVSGGRYYAFRESMAR